MEPLRHHAVLGDGRSAALIASSGSIDWLCWPRFDSPSLFGALLDGRAGRWTLAPTEPHRTERRYLPGTNVLETTHVTGGGAVVVTDLMAAASEEEKRASLTPDHQLIRQVECRSGSVAMEMIFEPRPRFGLELVRLRSTPRLGLQARISAGLLVLQTDMDLRSDGDRAHGHILLQAGQRSLSTLSLEHDSVAVLPPLGDHTRVLIDRTIRFWRGWSSRMRYDGPAREAVERSALALKLLAYAPSGAIVAAPTTSLPERIGGDLNWDYRFCWLRDASLTVRALFGLGFTEEAEAFLDWLIHSTQLTRPELRILYDVHGNRPPDERDLPFLRGYLDSRPVRIGNGAVNQLQLDVYGEVVDAAARYARLGGHLDGESRRMLVGFGEWVCRLGQQPDEGIWEPRSARVHHTHSRLLGWVALDRLLQMGATVHLSTSQEAAFNRTRALLRKELEERAWNPELRSYVATLGGDDVDASLLLLSLYGFEAAGSPRMKQTYDRIQEKLSAGNDLLYRYRTGEPPREGAFGICCFWGAEYLALGGGTGELALQVFDRLVRCGNDVGLFAEEIDPRTLDPLGNFPQGFTHVGLINAALSLQERLGREGLAA